MPIRGYEDLDEDSEIDQRMAAGRDYDNAQQQEWNERVAAIRARQEGDRADPGSDSLNPAELRKREKAPGQPDAPASPQDPINREFDNIAKNFDKTAPEPNYTKRGEPSRLRDRAKNFFQRNRKKLLLAGAGTGGVGVVIILLIILASSLFLPNFIEGIIAHRFFSSARSYRQGHSQVVAKKLSLSAADDESWRRQVKEKYVEIRKTVLLENFRPAKIVQNMFTEERLTFEEEERGSGILKRNRVTAIMIDGQRIPINDHRWYQPFVNYRDNRRLASELDQALVTSMRGQKGTIGTMIRTSVGSNILQKVGVRGLYAWINRGRDYRGLTPQQADVKMQAETYERSHQRPSTRLGVDATQKTADEADETRDRVVRTAGDQAAAIIDNGGKEPDAVVKVIEEGLKPSRMQRAVEFGSTAYAIAVPACMILDASLQRSGPLIDSKSAALQKQFLLTASGSDQATAGHGPGEGIGAMTKRFTDMGNFNTSVPHQRAAGGNPDSTAAMLSPHSSASGDFSLFNFILPEGAAQFMNNGVIDICPTLTNVWTGLGAGVAELVVGFFTGGTFTAAKGLGMGGVRAAFTSYLADFGRKLISKENFKRFGQQAALIGGLSLLAHSLTAQYSGGEHSGLARGADAANEVDAGAAILNTELNRQGLAGRPMTSQETLENNVADRELMQRSKAQLTFYERYFDVKNHQSLASNVLMNIAGSVSVTSLSQSFIGMAGNILNPSRLVGAFSGILSPKVAAADLAGRSNYQILEFAFSQAEERAIQSNPTYFDILENDYILMIQNKSKFDELKAEYGRCFTDSIGTLLAERLVARNTDGTIIENEGLCSPQNLGMNNPKYGDLVFRWRISMRADAVMQSLDEIQNPGQVAALSGNGPVSGQGDPQPLARELLKRADAGHIHLTDAARRDAQVVADGGNIGSCGASTIHPGVFQILLVMSHPSYPNYFKMSINNFVTDHDCEGGQHPRGRAVDIQNLNDRKIELWDTCIGIGKGGDGKVTPCGSAGGAEASRFVSAITAIMPHGSRIGQSTCTDVINANIPAYIENFVDTCHHIHIDMKDVP